MVAGSGGLVRAMLEPCVLSVSAIVATDCARGKRREPTMFDNVVYICVLMSFSEEGSKLLDEERSWASNRAARTSLDR